MDLQKIINDSLYFKYKVEEDATNGFATNLGEIGEGFSDVKVFVKADLAVSIINTIAEKEQFQEEYLENIKRQLDTGNFGIAYQLLEIYAQGEGVLEESTSLIHLVLSYYNSFKECALHFGLTQEEIFELIPEEREVYEAEQLAIKEAEEARIKAEQEEQARLKAEEDARIAEQARKDAEEAKRLATEKEEERLAKEREEAERLEQERLAKIKSEEEAERNKLEQEQREKFRLEEEQKQLEFENAVTERVNMILEERMKEDKSKVSSDVTVDKVLEDNMELKKHVLTLEEKLDKITDMIQHGETTFVPTVEEEEPDEPLTEDEFINVIDLIASRIPNSHVLRPIILLYKSGEVLEASYLLDNLLSQLSEEGVSFE